MKRQKLFAVLAAVFALTLLFAACTASTNAVFYVYKIVPIGTEGFEFPDDPVKEGFVFDGWYWDEGTWKQPLTINSVLDAKLKKNFSVYARWQEAGGQPSIPTDPTDPTDPSIPTDPIDPTDPTNPESACYTVIFKNGETVLNTQEVKAGKAAIAPEKIPQSTEGNFVGWYKDAAGTLSMNFANDFVTEDITLYAIFQLKTVNYKLSSDKMSYSVYGLVDRTAQTATILKDYRNLPVTSIDDRAFYECGALASIIIPDCVTSIGSNAFYGCVGLILYMESSTKPSGLRSDWNMTVNNCYCPVVWDYKNNDVAEDGNIYFIQDGIRYGIKDGAAAVANQSNAITTAIISDTIQYKDKPYTVTSIKPYSFYRCTALTNLQIPTSITTIGDVAFYGCAALTNIVIPDRVTSLGMGAFYGANLKSVEIPNSVTDIGPGAFWYCIEMTSAKIGNSVLSIGERAFLGCEKLTGMVIPKSVTNIGERAFLGCEKLTGMVIPKSVTSIGKSAFADCYGIETLMVEIGNTKYHSAENCIIETESKTLVAGCNNSIIPADGSVERIDFEAFRGSNRLTSILIPGSVTDIDEDAFSGCGGLTKIEVSEANKNYSSQDGILYNKEKTELIYVPFFVQGEVTIPKSLTGIGQTKFDGRRGLTSIIIPDGVTNVGVDAFERCDSLTIYVETSVKPSGWDSNWNSSSCPVIWDYNNKDEANDGYIYKIIDGIRYGIKDGNAEVAQQPINITKATIPKSITYKGKTYNVTSIVSQAFGKCSGLSSVDIGESVTSIGFYAFWECIGLTSVVIGDSVKCIDSGAFNGCSELISVVIGDSVTNIGSNVFLGCDKLNTITIKSGNSKYHNEGNCVIETESKTLVIGCKTGIIPADGSVTSIGNDAFSYYQNLTSVVIPNSVTSIDFNAFWGCNRLETITVENGNRKYHSAGNCLIDTESKTLVLGCKNSIIPADGSVTCIGPGAFDGCIGLTSIAIPNSVISIDVLAFVDCRSLKRVVIPDSIACIDNYAFFWCNSLLNIEYKGTKQEWNSIEKGSDWDSFTDSYLVTCSDGMLDKKGIEIS